MSIFRAMHLEMLINFEEDRPAKRLPKEPQRERQYCLCKVASRQVATRQRTPVECFTQGIQCLPASSGAAAGEAFQECAGRALQAQQPALPMKAASFFQAACHMHAQARKEKLM